MGEQMNFQELGTTAAKNETLARPVVKNRHLQYDADFACYEVSDLEEPLIKSYQRLLDHIEMKRVLAGAEHVNAVLTLGQKSGREGMATVKPYQLNRDPDAPIKVRVRELRHMLANATNLPDTITVVHNPMYEADDVLCKLQHERVAEFGIDSSVIMSGDKDLWMVLGWHCDQKTGAMNLAKGYGKTEYREVGNVKPKLVGEGRSWFWHQMIMGDKADNIPGLPKLDNKDMDFYFPLKSGKPRKEGSTACGEAKAVEVLKGVNHCVEAARRVYNLYWNYYGGRASEMFIEQAYLLWMQRDDNPWDVLKYLEAKGLNLQPSERQRKVIEGFKELCGL